MLAYDPARHLDQMAQRWCDLAERRREYFMDLYKSGRWKHYYDERAFLERIRDVVKATEAWRSLAGRGPATMPKDVQPELPQMRRAS